MKDVNQAIEAIRNWRGAHVLVYSGDGTGKADKLLFESSCAHESQQVCRLLEELLHERQEQP